MTNISNMNLNNIVEYPKTFEEAAEKLQFILDENQRNMVRSIKKDDLVWLHFSLGKNIRNAFGLNGDNTALLDGKSADEVSMDILKKYGRF